MKRLSSGEFYYGAKHIEALSDIDELLCIVDLQPPGTMRQAAINRLCSLEREVMYFVAAMTDIARLKKIHRTRCLGALFLSVATGRLKVLIDTKNAPTPKPTIVKLSAHDSAACGCVYIGLSEYSCGFRVAA